MLASVKSFFIAFAVAILIFGLIGYLFMPQIKSLADGFFTPGIEEPEDTEAVQYVAPDVPDPQKGIISSGAVFPDHKSFTMLLIGSDYQPDVFSDYRVSVQNTADIEQLSTHQRHYKADVVMVVRYNAETGVIMLSAIPTNLMVSASGIQMELCDVLERKNASYFTELVSGIIGINIDYYICCRISLFKDIVNRLGGVKYDVPVDMYYVDEEERIVAEGASRDPIPLVINDEPVLDSEGNPVMIPAGKAFTINLSKGIQTLNGEQASWVLRYNVYAHGFVGRRETINTFFRAFFESALKEDNHAALSAVFSLISSSDAAESNMTPSDFEDFAKTILSYSRYEKSTVVFPCTITGTGEDERATFSRNSTYTAYEKYKNR